MKRIAVVLLSILVLVCGCQPTNAKKEVLPSLFCANAKIAFDGMDYEAKLERHADGMWKVEFLAPDAVKGLIFTTEGEETDISFNGLHFTFDTQKFPVGSVVSMLTKSVDRIVHCELSVVEGETTDFATGEAEGLSFALTLDKNGIPLSLELGDSGMKVEFLEFEILNFEE